ncbi:MAG: ABC transporter permease subunit [Actinomycetota bacterium]
MSASRAIGRLPILNAVVWITLVFMAALIVYPLVLLVKYVFFANGTLDLSGIVDTFKDPALGPTLLHTLLVIVVVVPISVIIGGVLAWLNERTDARMGWVADTLPIIPLLIPVVATAIGWATLLAPSAGYLNAFLRMIFTGNPTGTGPFNIYGALGTMGVMTIVVVPLAYLTISAALRNMDPALEEASRMSGASPFRTLVRITFPAVRNAVATATVLAVINVISQFTIALILGSSSGFDVIGSMIYHNIDAPNGPNFPEMVVLSFFMLVIVQVAVIAEYMISRSGHHARIGGKGRGRAINTLGGWKWVVRAVEIVYLLVATVVPLFGLLLLSLQNFWTPAIRWSFLTFQNYVDIFSGNTPLGRAFADSLLLGLLTATVLMLIASILVYQVSTSRGWLGKAVNAVTALPAAIPHMIIGVAFLLSLGVGFLSLQGSLLLLFLAYLVLALPQATRTAGSAFSQVGREMWEGSLMAGASQFRTFVQILIPLMRSGLLAGWVMVFVITFSETSASVFLSSSVSNPVAGSVILSFLLGSSGTYPQIAALCLVVALLQTIVVFGVRWLGRDRDRGGAKRPSRATRVLENGIR